CVIGGVADRGIRRHGQDLLDSHLAGVPQLDLEGKVFVFQRVRMRLGLRLSSRRRRILRACQMLSGFEQAKAPLADMDNSAVGLYVKMEPRSPSFVSYGRRGE